MTELLGGGLVLVALAVVGVALWARRDKVSLRDELHTRMDNLHGLFNVHAMTISDALHKLETAKPEPVAPEPVVGPWTPEQIQGARDRLFPPPTEVPTTAVQPKEEAMRDEMTEGPKLMAALPERLYPGVGNAGGRVIAYYCQHPESTYADAYKAVVIDGASNYASAVEQPYRTGRFPVEALADNVLASVYLNYMSGAYTAAVHRSIWTDMLRGEKDLVSMFINLGGSTNAGMLGTFDPDGYSSPVKDAVVQAMAAGG